MRVGALIATVLVALLATGCASEGGGSSNRLTVGDCIDIPTSDAVTSIPRASCSEPHTGEVFHVFDAQGMAGAYPSDPDWKTLIYPICDPAFEAYTGTPVETRTDIDYIYLVPTSDRWTNGDRRVTCVINSLDGTPLTRSHRGEG